MRRLGTSVIPDVYDSMMGDEKKKLADAGDMSHFRAGIEYRAMDTPSDYCKDIRTKERVRAS